MDGKLDRLSYGTVSLVTQGKHRFYSLTMPSEVLAVTCVALSRDEDNIAGFQRSLDEKRAREIATYIDSGMGTIPSSIVLSAQGNSGLEYDARKKSISFNNVNNAFLILDGQHRVFGFALAKSNLRVPVVIYEGLNRVEESRLFIDINSKQKGVPSELLLDIKKLAEYENDAESRMRHLFDWFKDDTSSILFQKLSPASKINGKISRTIFNTSVAPLVKIFGGMDDADVYKILKDFYQASYDVMFDSNMIQNEFFQATVFKAVSNFFPTVARKSKDRYGQNYNYDNFTEILIPVGQKMKISKIRDSKNAFKPIVKHFEECLESDFQL